MRFLLAAVALLPVTAHGITTAYTLAENSDASTVGSIKTTAYPNGDAPIAGAECSSLTCVAEGDAVDEDIAETNATTFVVKCTGGSDDEGNACTATTTFSPGNDLQAVATISAPADWIGTKENYTGFGVLLRDASGDHQAWLPNVGVAEFKADAGGAGETRQTGGTYSSDLTIGITYDESETDVCAFVSTDGGSNWTELGSCFDVDLNGTLTAGIFGTSHNVATTIQDTLTNVSIGSTITISAAPPAGPYLPVVPGLFSFGTGTSAGRGGTIYVVDSLDDSGSGTLRACAEASGPRTCVFETSGRIPLSTDIEVIHSNLTIAGQTAPAPGIWLTGAGIVIKGADDILLQHMTVAAGDADAGPPQGGPRQSQDPERRGEYRRGSHHPVVGGR